MANSTKTTPGEPTSGLYAVLDKVTDSNGTEWICIVAGFANGATLGAEGQARFIASPPQINSAGTAIVANATVESAVSATVAKVDYSNGFVHRTKLTLTDVAQAVVNGTEYQGTKLITFPEGGILVLGARMTIAQKTTSILVDTLNTGSTGALSLGSVTASNVALTSTMANFIASTAFTSSATINVAGTAVSAMSTAGAWLNGTGTAAAVFINTGYATTGDIDADATQTLTGTIELTWIWLGDH